MKAYKGFDKDLKCRGFQYEIGKEFKTDKADLCHSGFHACGFPMDVFSYYEPYESKFCEVELLEETNQKEYDSKRCGRKIKIGAEIGIKGIIDASIKFIFEHAATQGEYAHASVKGENSIACSLGRYGLAKGELGCWIAVAEYDNYGNVIGGKFAKVDGKKIKPDTYYCLKNGDFEEKN